ncbi:MAG: PqiC family protein [Gammaproteobacteria bacterium]
MKLGPTAAALLLLLCACVSSRPDRFYVLSAQPPAAGATRSSPALQATLKATLPSLVDRAEMVLNTSADGVTVLEHERWAAPLADLVTQTLARDIERRRSDVLVGSYGLSHSIEPAIKISVDIVQVWMRRGERASIETHWRILDTRSGKQVTGGDIFSAALGQEGYDAVAQVFSECLGLLADRLADQMPRAE